MEHKPFAITLHPNSSRANHTGNWRTFRPVYAEHLPPCNHACPAGENIQAWLYHAEEGRYELAWRQLMEDNPFPAIHGRVCYHPCETACNRGSLDKAVNIHAVERFLGDHAIEQGWRVPRGAPTGKTVMVVGAGPSGLSAAYHLARLGHAVTVYDAGSAAGGMMRHGIPAYRLPRDILDAEVARIEAMGVLMQLNTPVTDVEAFMTQHGYDAAYLAIGAHVSKRVDIPGGDARRVLDALAVLEGVEQGAPIRLGRRVAVYGGGNTAIDAARTAQRLGADETLLIYRRDRDHMPAHHEEVEEALAEGVVMRWLRSITKVDDGALEVEEMVLDANGRPTPTGRRETLAADTVILALGQDVDTSFLRSIPDFAMSADGVIQVDEHMMTSRPGLFAGGDAVPAERTVTVATGHGKRAARHIDAYLRSTHYHKSPASAPASLDRINSWYYSDADQTHEAHLDLVRRQHNFDEVVYGLDERTAVFEARRCLSCGTCFECDNCFGVCPDNAVKKLGPGQRYAFDYDYCKGCGLCAEECPSGAIDMIKEVR